MAIKPKNADETIPAVEIYKQQYAHFGRMNDLLYKLPTIYSALFGALWYFAFTSIEKDRFISAVVFCFAAVVCWYSITITQRFRLAFNQYIDRINKFDREYLVTIRPPSGSLSTMRAVIGTLWFAFGFSVMGAGYVALPFAYNLVDTVKTICASNG